MDLEDYGLVNAFVETLQGPLPDCYQEFPWYILIWLFYFSTLLLSFKLGSAHFMIFVSYNMLVLVVLMRIIGKL